MEREQRVNEDECSADSNVNMPRCPYIAYLMEIYTLSLTSAWFIQVFQLWDRDGGKLGKLQMLKHFGSTLRRTQSIAFV